MEDDPYDEIAMGTTQAPPPVTTTTGNKNIPTTAANTSPTVLMQAKPQSTGKSRAMMLVALIATIAIMVLAVIMISVIFSPQSSNSNSDIEAMKQQIENLRMAVSQIQQTNVSSLKATFGTEISRQSIQDMIDNSIQQLQVQVENKVENLALSLTQDSEEIIHEVKLNASRNFEQLNIQMATASAGIHSRIDTLEGEVNKLVIDIQALQWEVQANNTATKLEIAKRVEELNELRSTLNATESKLNKKLANETKSLSEIQLSIQGVEERAKHSENMIENIENLTLSITQDFKEIIYDMNSTASQKFKQLEIQLANSSAEIQLELKTVTKNASKSAEDILALQLEVEAIDTAVQTELQELMLQFESTINETQKRVSRAEVQLSNDLHRPMTCDELSQPSNGEIIEAPGPNSLSRGLWSIAIYLCDPGYALVGQGFRTCEDTNGGTVTTGTWSGTASHCQGVVCLALRRPPNGNVITSSPQAGVGTTANYSCDPGYVLVGQTTRTCIHTNPGVTGTWNGRSPHCEVIIRCQPLTQPGNGAVTISSGTHGVTLGRGATATYYCNTGYGLVGQAIRTCVVTNGGTTGTWSGSQPTCQEAIIGCPPLSALAHGTITLISRPGADNSNYGLGSVATYSCNPGYVLVGQTTRECQPIFGNTGIWNGSQPTCEEAVYCPALTPPDNGTVSISSGVNYLSVGSTATYSCDPGYALLGSTTRTCEDPDRDSVGTWTGSMPNCQVILCSVLTAPDNGTIEFIDTSQLLGVGTTATYSCDPGYVLVGDTNRTCEDTNSRTTGTWSGEGPICAVPNRALTDCFGTPCRYEQLVCPEQDNCTVNCNDSRPYACFRTAVVCPSGTGDCTVNCDDSHACVQANTTCSQGDCTVNCENDYTCLSSVMECSGENCLLNCEREESCSNSILNCLSGNCTLNCKQRRGCSYLNAQCSGDNCLINCEQDYSCQRSNVECTNGNCTINCRNDYSCLYSTVLCPLNGICTVNCGDTYSRYACHFSQFTCPGGGNCVFKFDGQSHGDYNGYYAVITCQENSTCDIYCTGLTTSAHRQCYNSRITCPMENGDCTIECSGYYSCQYSTVMSGPRGDSLSCSGEYSCNRATIVFPSTSAVNLSCQSHYSCQLSRIFCPVNNNCTINCDGQYSCQNARVTCPTGDYSCNILCTDPLSCSNLSITNTHNVYLQCCGGLSCAGTSVTPASTECPYIN